MGLTNQGEPLTLVAMCGRSFSGKSTIASDIAKVLSAELVSLDAINEERGLRGGDGIPVSEWAHTNDVAHERAAEALRRGRSVVVDDTNALRFLRDRWRQLAAIHGVAFSLVYVHAREDLIRKRIDVNLRSLHRHDVTDGVLRAHLDQFEEPAAEEHAIAVDGEASPSAADVLRLMRGTKR